MPSPWSMLREARFLPDLAAGLAALPALARAPRGDGEPVLVLPGYGAGDSSTALLRAFLRSLGYRAEGWGLGRNGGDVGKLLPRVLARTERLFSASDRAVRLVGWSLGGVLAREAAREAPRLVERVVTLGSPVVGGPKYTAAGGLYRRRGFDLDAIEREITARNAARPIRVPIHAIYSRRDGVVAWQACVDRASPDVEHVEVPSTHSGLGFDARVLALVADRLARQRR
jgi:hypothetical protein